MTPRQLRPSPWDPARAARLALEQGMRQGDVVRRKALLREVYREIRLWPKTGRKAWTRKVLVAANVEALTRPFVVSPTGTDLFGLTPPLRGVVRVA